MMLRVLLACLTVYLASADVNAKMTFANESWVLVRRVSATEGVWHPIDDNLAGSTAYGIRGSDTSESTFGIEFANRSFTKFLFATGDKAHWAVINRTNVYEVASGDRTLNVLSSELSTTPNLVTWYNRPGQTEDPWISNQDHGCSDDASCSVLYGEMYVGHDFWRDNNNGANVWINSGNTAQVVLSLSFPKLPYGAWSSAQTTDLLTAFTNIIGESATVEHVISNQGRVLVVITVEMFDIEDAQFLSTQILDGAFARALGSAFNDAVVLAATPNALGAAGADAAMEAQFAVALRQLVQQDLVMPALLCHATRTDCMTLFGGQDALISQLAADLSSVTLWGPRVTPRPQDMASVLIQLGRDKSMLLRWFCRSIKHAKCGSLVETAVFAADWIQRLPLI